MTQEQIIPPGSGEVADRQAAGKVAILDDSDTSSHNLTIKLRFIGEHPRVFSSNATEELVQALANDDYFALIIGDLSGSSAGDQLRLLQQRQVDIPVIIAGNHLNTADIDESLRSRVIAFYKRPVHYEALIEGLNLARRQKGMESRQFESALMSETGSPLFRCLVGDSIAMQHLQGIISSLEGQSVTVLISGEEGSGMEIVARNLHYGSGRRDKAFVGVNCAALSTTGAIVELFGSDSGFNGTSTRRTGYLERADGGTLYLDRVEELPMEAQARLASFMETGTFDRLGGLNPVRADVRMIAAATSDIEHCITHKTFRSDLFYQLNVFPIAMPALRQRVEDIPELVNELVSRLQHRQRAPVSFDHEALQSLKHHHWPGNIRELANLVERLGITRANGTVSLNDLPPEYHHRGALTEAEVGEYEAIGEGAAEAASKKDADRKGLGPEYAISLEGELNDRVLGDALMRFERSMLEVALEDTLFMEAMAAERLGISLEELTSRRARLSL